jgi:hypothetical protein
MAIKQNSRDDFWIEIVVKFIGYFILVASIAALIIFLKLIYNVYEKYALLNNLFLVIFYTSAILYFLIYFFTKKINRFFYWLILTISWVELIISLYSRFYTGDGLNNITLTMFIIPPLVVYVDFKKQHTKKQILNYIFYAVAFSLILWTVYDIVFDLFSTHSNFHLPYSKQYKIFEHIINIILFIITIKIIINMKNVKTEKYIILISILYLLIFGSVAFFVYNKIWYICNCVIRILTWNIVDCLFLLIGLYYLHNKNKKILTLLKIQIFISLCNTVFAILHNNYGNTFFTNLIRNTSFSLVVITLITNISCFFIYKKIESVFSRENERHRQKSNT